MCADSFEGIDFGKLHANSTILIIGGSETTATLLSGVTHLLLRNPPTLEKLTQEVRLTFKREEEINFSSVSNLTYMLACLDEALRMYPPVPGGLPRVVPTGGATICDYFVPENVSLFSNLKSDECISLPVTDHCCCPSMGDVS